VKVEHLKWVFVAVVVAAFLPWWIMTASRESSSQDAIESDPKFAKPKVNVKFSKTIQWDGQSFLGRGRTAGFWDWTPKGVVLTPKGQNLFEDDQTSISGDLVVGARKLTTIKSVQPRGAEREVLFLFVWTELTDMTKLLNASPVIGKEYQAVATLAETGGVWKMKSLSTPDFTTSLLVLTTETSR
jgi:hypothetical protein